MPTRKINFIAVLISFTCLLSACGSSGGGSSSDDTDAINNSLVTEASEDLGANPTARVSTENFGEAGNLWKPAGDDHAATPGSVVAILGPKHSEQFDSCEADMRDGSTKQLVCINNVPWTHMPFSCFANPSHGGYRQHWRTFESCHDFAAVRVRCYLGGQEYLFKAPDGQAGSVCTRFG